MTSNEMQDKFVGVILGMMSSDDLVGLDWKPEDYRIKLDDILDSLDRVEFVMELEEDFDIQIDDHEAMKWITVQDAYLYVNQKVVANARG